MMHSVDEFDVSTIAGLSIDSRSVKTGYLFAALKGAQVDGRDFIPQAIENGAKVVVTDAPVDVPDDVQLVIAQNPAQTLAGLAAKFYAPQPAHVAAVTGTNGKTSVVNFTQQIWAARGAVADSIGTLTGQLTTPDAIALMENLGQKAQEGVTHLALEASSHGLDQYRLDGVALKTAGFTNLSHDHLDYHADMAEYLSAKIRLFGDLLPEDGVAVLNADVPEFEALTKITKASVISYGQNGADLKIIATEPHENGQNVTLDIFGHRHEFILPLVGVFQLSNILCALGMSFLSAEPSEIQIEESVEALKNIKPAPGRLQSIEGHPAGAKIFIDYAHTPDALENILNTLRHNAKGILICIFGCGGDRDAGKRPLMGAVSARFCDKIIITDDNPRSENPVYIRKQILDGIHKMNHTSEVLEIGDRAAAIDHSIKNLNKDDVLVIAGKGHETGQIIGSKTIPFDDAQEAIKAIEGLKR